MLFTSSVGDAQEEGCVPSERAGALLLRLDETQLAEYPPEVTQNAIGPLHIAPLLATMERTPTIDFQLGRFASKLPPLNDLASAPADYQWRVFRLVGQITHVEPVVIPPVFGEQATDEGDSAEPAKYFACRFQLQRGETGGPEIVISMAYDPLERLREGRRDEIVMVVDAVFVAKETRWNVGEDGEAATSGQRLLFVANRAQWRDDSLLGRLGLDMSLLENVYVQPVRASSGERVPLDIAKMQLTEDDNPAFYAMLNAVGRAGPGELYSMAMKDLRKSGKDEYSVLPLFNEPESQQGRLVALEGECRRATRIAVTDRIARAQYGIDYYYELYVYPRDSRSNPVVFCVRELPAEMPLGSGPEYRERVRVAGFFFKTWAYKATVEFEKNGFAEQWQLAPLLIGESADWLPPPDEEPDSGTFLGILLWNGVVLLLLLLGAGLWLWSRRKMKATPSATEVVRGKWFANDGQEEVPPSGPQSDEEPRTSE